MVGGTLDGEECVVSALFVHRHDQRPIGKRHDLVCKRPPLRSRFDDHPWRLPVVAAVGAPREERAPVVAKAVLEGRPDRINEARIQRVGADRIAVRTGCRSEAIVANLC